MVISVNGKKVTQNTADECRDYIKSLTGDVTIVTTDTAAILGSKMDNTRIPPLLEEAGVSQEKWSAMVNLVETELLPPLKVAVDLAEAMKASHRGYVLGQMVGGASTFH